MALERNWEAVPPVPFTSMGTTMGRITVTSTKYFKVKMEVIVEGPLLPKLQLEVKRVLSPTVMELGPRKGSINERTDLSSYGPAGPSIVYSYEQVKHLPSPKEMDLASYAQEPTNARRVALVDRWGRKIDSVEDGDTVRLAVDAKINIASAEVNIEYPNQSRIDNITGTGLEQVLVLPLKTGNFYIKCRNGTSEVLFSTTLGGTLLGPYIRIERGASYTSPQVDKDPITLYLLAKPGSVIEVLSWYKV